MTFSLNQVVGWKDAWLASDVLRFCSLTPRYCCRAENAVCFFLVLAITNLRKVPLLHIPPCPQLVNLEQVRLLDSFSLATVVFRTGCVPIRIGQGLRRHPTGSK